MALGDLVAWPTGDDLRDWITKQGVTNVVDSPIHDQAVEAVCVHVAEIQRRSFADDIPATVRTAILIQAHRLSRRPASPEGVAGLGPDGTAIRLTRLDPDVAEMLAPDMHIPIAAA